MYFLRLVLTTVKQISRLVLKRWRKPPEKTELAKCLEKFYLCGRQKDRGSAKQLLIKALELAKKALDAFVKTLRKDGEIACLVNN